MTQIDHQFVELISVSCAGTKPMKTALAQVKKAHLAKRTISSSGSRAARPMPKAGLRREIPAPVVALFGTIAGRRYRRDFAPVWS